jgi:hypothetical protein
MRTIFSDHKGPSALTALDDALALIEQADVVAFEASIVKFPSEAPRDILRCVTEIEKQLAETAWYLVQARARLEACRRQAELSLASEGFRWSAKGGAA